MFLLSIVVGKVGKGSNELVKNCSSGMVTEAFLVGDLDRLAKVLCR